MNGVLGDLLAHGIAELGLAVPGTTQARLLAYLGLIEKWNRIYNLTAVRDPRDMLHRHLLDSLAVVPYVSAHLVLDVGSGAGLPGIPLAMTWPKTQVTLLDSNQKKTAFLQQAVIELGLTNVTVVCDRVETWRPGHEFDLVISRAFSDLPELVEVAGRLCAADGVLAAMKGIYPHGELAQLTPVFKLERVIPLTVPGLSEARHLVLLRPAH
jgi:16S rRNA (guanine527-N7)-methyltransferase